MFSGQVAAGRLLELGAQLVAVLGRRVRAGRASPCRIAHGYGVCIPGMRSATGAARSQVGSTGKRDGERGQPGGHPPAGGPYGAVDQRIAAPVAVVARGGAESLPASAAAVRSSTLDREAAARSARSVTGNGSA